jgi:DNA-binding Xre family transcriptional regulator
MFRQKVSIIEKLKESGYSTYRIFKEKIFGSATMTKFRNGGVPSWNELDKICTLCKCNPWDIIEYIPGNREDD